MTEKEIAEILKNTIFRDMPDHYAKCIYDACKVNNLSVEYFISTAMVESNIKGIIQAG